MQEERALIFAYREFWDQVQHEKDFGAELLYQRRGHRPLALLVCQPQMRLERVVTLVLLGLRGEGVQYCAFDISREAIRFGVLRSELHQALVRMGEVELFEELCETLNKFKHIFEGL